MAYLAIGPEPEKLRGISRVFQELGATSLGDLLIGEATTIQSSIGIDDGCSSIKELPCVRWQYMGLKQALINASHDLSNI